MRVECGNIQANFTVFARTFRISRTSCIVCCLRQVSGAFCLGYLQVYFTFLSFLVFAVKFCDRKLQCKCQIKNILLKLRWRYEADMWNWPDLFGECLQSLHLKAAWSVRIVCLLLLPSSFIVCVYFSYAWKLWPTTCRGKSWTQNLPNDIKYLKQQQ